MTILHWVKISKILGNNSGPRIFAYDELSMVVNKNQFEGPGLPSKQGNGLLKIFRKKQGNCVKHLLEYFVWFNPNLEIFEFKTVQ